MHIVIHTGLKSFLLLDRIMEVGANHIVGSRTFAGEPVSCGLESLAQLGALFVRNLTNFSKHVFLLTIVRCILPGRSILTGEYLFAGELISRSDSAFLIRVTSRQKQETIMEGDLLFGSVDYDHRFKEETLSNHYRKVFQCLCNDSKID